MDISTGRGHASLNPIGPERTLSMSAKPSPNDQRSNVKNPNNPAYEADRANRIGLGHPAVPPPPPPPPDQTPPAAPKKP